MALGKPDMVNHVTKECTVTKEQAQKAVEAVLEGITKSLEVGEEVRILGFGTFAVRETKAREGRHPRTGDSIKIAASKRVIFRPGKELKDITNGKTEKASASTES